VAVVPIRQRLATGVAVAAALTFVAFGVLALNVAALTRLQAQAVAQAVNLTANDVPGFKASPIPPSVFSRTGGCPGEVPRRRWLAFAHSDAFQQGAGNSFLEVNSAATVMPTAKLARRDLAALRGKRGRKCLADAVKRTFAGSRFKVLRLTVTSRRPPAPGGIGLRVKLRLSSSQGVVTEYADALLFVRKQVTVALDTGSQGRPFPARLERHLSGLLVARAKRIVR
jgi:hypothetical protein